MREVIEVTEEEFAILERQEQILREINDRAWLALGVSQEELDRDHLEDQWIREEMDKGRDLGEILKELDAKIDEKAAEKPRRRRSPKPPIAVRP